MINLSKLKFYRFHFVLILCLLAIYGVLFTQDAFLSYDDNMVISTLQSIHSFHDYLVAHRSGVILDLQPVRDLVTWLDYQVLDHFNLSIFHFTNVLIWLFAMLALRKLAMALRIASQKMIEGGVLLIAVNPLYVSSVSWLSARKHLLAVLFMLWASVHFIRFMQNHAHSRVRLWSANFLYFLALLSQPIILFWPVLMGLYLIGQKKMRLWKVLIPSTLLMLLIAGLNLNYYTSQLFHYVSFGVPKYSDSMNQGYPFRMFALGRYFFQVICPYWTSIAIYDFKSWRGLAGICLFPLVTYFFIKTTRPRYAGFAMAAFFLFLFPVVARMTQIFGTDSYVISASIAVYLLALRSTCHFQIARPRILSGLFVVILISITAFSRNRAEAWNSHLGVFTQSFELEGGDFSNEQYMRALLFEKRSREAIWYAQAILKDDPNNSMARSLIVEAIFMDPDLSSVEKLKQIQDLKFEDAVPFDFMARLQSGLGHDEEASKLLEQVMKMSRWFLVVSPDPEAFAYRVLQACEKSKLPDCARRVEEVRERMGVKWKEDKYIAFEKGSRGKATN